VQHVLKGWILLQTKEKELLKRIDLLDSEIATKGDRFSFIKNTISRQVSSKCTRFKALNQVHVYYGNEEPSTTVIDELKPGAVVYGDKLMRSMLRIVKADACGNIQLGYRAQPQPYGWVMLRRIEDGLPQFEVVPQIRKHIQQKTINHGEDLNNFNRIMLKNQDNRPNNENFKNNHFIRAVEELDRGIPCL